MKPLNFEFPDTFKPVVTTTEETKSKKTKKLDQSDKKKITKPSKTSKSTTSMEISETMALETYSTKKILTNAWQANVQKPFSARVIFDKIVFLYGFNQSTEPFSLILVYYSGLEDLLLNHNKTL